MRRLESREDHSSAARAAMKAANDKAFAKTNPGKPKPLSGCPLMRNPPAHMHPSNFSPPPSRMDALGGTNSDLSMTMGSPPPGSTNLNVMLRNATSGTGGASGGDGGSITTLKADLLAVQTEIDMLTGQAGTLDLQGSIGRFAWRPSDPSSNQTTIMTLQSLLLLKLNEAAKLITLRDSAVAPLSPPQSRVGDMLTLLRKVGRPLQMPSTLAAEASTRKKPSSPTRSPKVRPTSVEDQAISRLAANAAGLPPLQANVLNSHLDAPDWTVQGSNNTAPPSASHKESIGQSTTTPQLRSTESPLVITDATTGEAMAVLPISERPQQRNSSSASGQVVPTQVQEAQNSSAKHRANTPITLHTQLEEAHDTIRQLRKQLSLFQYLEKNMHQMDFFDNTLRTSLVNPTLQELGLELKSLVEATIPPHSIQKDGRFKPSLGPIGPPTPAAVEAMQSAFAKDKAAVTGPVAARIQAKSESEEVASQDNATETSPTVVGMTQERETAAVMSLRAVVAFQNAVTQLLIDELRARSVGRRALPSRSRPRTQQHGAAVTAEGADSQIGNEASRAQSRHSDLANRRHVATPDRVTLVSEGEGSEGSDDDVDIDQQTRLVAELREKVSRLEKALDMQREQLQMERTTFATVNDRSANLLAIDRRARTTTPSGQTRLFTADAPVSQLTATAATRPLSRLHIGMPTASNNAILNGLVPLSKTPDLTSGDYRLGTSGGQRAPGTSPVIATSQTQLDGVEKALRRTIQDQNKIIKDLQQQQQASSRAQTAATDSSMGSL